MALCNVMDTFATLAAVAAVVRNVQRALLYAARANSNANSGSPVAHIPTVAVTKTPASAAPHRPQDVASTEHNAQVMAVSEFRE